LVSYRALLVRIGGAPEDEGPISLSSPSCNDHRETPCTSPLR
jgi:hypothetical protein